MGLIIYFGLPGIALAKDKLTPEEQAYLDKALNTPLTVTIPKEISDDAWGRIQVFIARYSDMKFQTSTEFVIDTYKPTEGKTKFGSNTNYGYSANRLPMGDQVEIQVNCMVPPLFSKKSARHNAHILAYFAVTGELMPQLLKK